jgi:uncharacterized protein (TIGR02186 family)
MRYSLRPLGFAVVIIAVGGGLVPAPCAAAQPAPVAADSLAIQPREVPIGLFYGGTTIEVTAEVPAGRPYAILLEGHPKPLTVKRKGKVWGLLWMNVAEEEFAEVPTVYLLQTNAPLRDLASDEQLAAAGLGYDALVRRAGGDAVAFQELVELKEKEGFFAIDPSALVLAATAQGTAHLSASFPLAARIPAGEYTVRLYGFSGGDVQLMAQSVVKLEQIGLVLAMHTLAMEHGLLFGCTAVAIAMLAGFSTGLVFGRGSSAGH